MDGLCQFITHGLCCSFLTSFPCSSVDPFQEVQFFRNRLLQHRIYVRPQILSANLLPHGLLSPWLTSPAGTCSRVGFPQGHSLLSGIHLLWNGLQVDLCLLRVLHGCRDTAPSPWSAPWTAGKSLLQYVSTSSLFMAICYMF